VLFRRYDDPDVAALDEVWGHSGSGHGFLYYWPSEDVVVVGTLNQLAVETPLYDIVAEILQLIRSAS
jgi:hypothetical protein